MRLEAGILREAVDRVRGGVHFIALELEQLPEGGADPLLVVHDEDAARAHCAVPPAEGSVLYRVTRLFAIRTSARVGGVFTAIASGDTPSGRVPRSSCFTRRGMIWVGTRKSRSFTSRMRNSLSPGLITRKVPPSVRGSRSFRRPPSGPSAPEAATAFIGTMARTYSTSPITAASALSDAGGSEAPARAKMYDATSAPLRFVNTGPERAFSASMACFPRAAASGESGSHVRSATVVAPCD